MFDLQSAQHQLAQLAANASHERQLHASPQVNLLRPDIINMVRSPSPFSPAGGQGWPEYTRVKRSDLLGSVTKLDRRNAESLLNSADRIWAQLNLLNLLPVAQHGVQYGAPETSLYGSKADADLAEFVAAVVAGDTEIETSLRLLGPSGHVRFQHVLSVYAKPASDDADTARVEITAFDYEGLAALDGKGGREKLLKLSASIARLPLDQRSTPTYWVAHVLKRLPTGLHSAFARAHSQMVPSLAHRAAHDFNTFTEVVATALDDIAARATWLRQQQLASKSLGAPYSTPGQGGPAGAPPPEPPPTVNATKAGEEDKERPRTEKAKPRCLHCKGEHDIAKCPTAPKCSECSSVYCPKAAKPELECVHTGNPPQEQVEKLSVKKLVHVNKRRVVNKLPVLKHKSAVNAMLCPPAAASQSTPLAASPSPPSTSEPTAPPPSAVAATSTDDAEQAHIDSCLAALAQFDAEDAEPSSPQCQCHSAGAAEPKPQAELKSACFAFVANIACRILKCTSAALALPMLLMLLCIRPWSLTSGQSAATHIMCVTRGSASSPSSGHHESITLLPRQIGVDPRGLHSPSGPLSFDRPRTMLLDTASDLTFFTDPQFFLHIGPCPSSDATAGTGNVGGEIHFLGCGPAAALLEDENGGRVLVFYEKAYLAAADESSNEAVMACGKSAAKQKLFLDIKSEYLEVPVIDKSVLVAQLKYSYRNSTPVLQARPALKHTWLPRPPLQVASIKSKNISTQLAHLRCIHAAKEVCSRAYGQKIERMCDCHVCKLYRSKAPPAPPRERSKLVGELVFCDKWEYSKDPVPAVATGHICILGALDDACNQLDAWSCTEPTGALVARWVEWLALRYASEYGVDLLELRFDNGTIFDCDPVRQMMAKHKIKQSFTAPYYHNRLKIERHWQTVQLDGAIACHFAKKTKGLFVHAVLHAICVRNMITIDEGQTLTRYEIATKKKPPLQLLRVFASPSYAHVMIEERLARRMGKFDPRSVYGDYVGCDPIKHTFLMATAGKVHSVGAIASDELAIIKAAPKGHGEWTAALEDALGPDAAFDGNGQRVDLDAMLVPQAESPAVAQAAPPPTQRPRDRVLRSAAPPPAPAAAPTALAPAARPPPSKSRPRVQVMVPAGLYKDRYSCAEFGGAGWAAEIVATHRRSGKVRVLFKHARDDNGLPFERTWLRRQDVELLSSAGLPCGTDANGSAALDVTPASIACIAAMLPKQHNSLHTSEDIEEEAAARLELCRMAAHAGPEMLLTQVAAHSTCRKVEQIYLNPSSGPVWVEKPSTHRQVEQIASGPLWMQAESSKLDKLESLKAFMLVSLSYVRSLGVPIYRLLWEYKVKVDRGELQRSARLCFDNTSQRDHFSEETTFADCAPPIAYRTLLHIGAADGATMVRRDVPDAHQTTIRPEAEKAGRYTFAPPGQNLTINGEPAALLWLNYLNGMPTAAAGFSAAFDEHVLALRVDGHGFMQSIIYERVFTMRLTNGEYLFIAVIVDDVLVVTKSSGDHLLVALDAHMEAKWPGMKHRDLDGFLNISLTRDLIECTVVFSLRIKVEAIMAEHFSEHMHDAHHPETPYHPQLLDLELEPMPEGAPPRKHSVEQRASVRLCMQLLYLVNIARFDAMFPVYHASRYNSFPPMPLHWEALKRVALYLHGSADCDLVLGGNGDDPALRSVSCDFVLGASADSGHAEDGPSTGGHTIEFGSSSPVVVHASCGRHRITTLGTSDAELYEASKCAATLEAHQLFCQEIGYPQEEAPALRCDNAAVVAIAASGSAFKRSLYMARRARFLQEMQRRRRSRVAKVASEDNVADVLTKVFSTKSFKRARHKLLNLRHRPQVTAVRKGFRVRFAVV